MASSKGKSKTRKATTAKTAKTKTTKAKSAVKKKTAKKKTAKKAAKAAKPKTKTGVAPKAKKAKPDQNRRRFDRRNTRIQAELDHDGALTKGTVTNLSLAGCLFEPQIKIAVGSRVKLKLAGETKPVAATVKGVTEQGVHCLLHAGGVTLGRLSADLDDMALLMLNAGRPHDITPPALAPKRGK